MIATQSAVCPCGSARMLRHRAQAVLPVQSRRLVVMRFREREPSPQQEDLMQRRAQAEAVRRQQEQKLKEEHKSEESQPASSRQTVGVVERDFTRLFKTLRERPAFPNHLRAPKVGPLQPAFTRNREILVGRIAMLGFFAASFLEVTLPDHPNIMQQLATDLPISRALIATLIGSLILYNAVGALMPNSPTWSRDNRLDVDQRPAGPVQGALNPLDYKQFFGVTEWGFTKANELFLGRLAMLGFLGSLMQQMQQGGYGGPGPVAQFAGLFGLPAGLAYATAPLAFLGFIIFATFLAYRNGRPGTISGENDIY